jgi:hypothetical protein
MILASHGIIGSQIVQFVPDVDAQAFFDRVDTAGGTLSATEQTAINTLVVQMKADGIWTKMKAIYPMVGASAAACAQNLKSSSFTGSFTSGWTYASTGVTPNGTSAHLNTNFTPSSSLSSSTSTHMSFYSRTNNNGNYIEMGCESISNDRLAFHFKYAGTAYYDQNDFTNGRLGYSMSVINSTGFSITSRTANNLQKAYLNNSLKGTNTNTITSNLPNRVFYIGAFNFNSIITDRSNRECAFASIGDGLTDTEASDFYTAVQAFQTTLSRQV